MVYGLGKVDSLRKAAESHSTKKSFIKQEGSFQTFILHTSSDTAYYIPLPRQRNESIFAHAYKIQRPSIFPTLNT